MRSGVSPDGACYDKSKVVPPLHHNLYTPPPPPIPHVKTLPQEPIEQQPGEPSPHWAISRGPPPRQAGDSEQATSKAANLQGDSLAYTVASQAKECMNPIWGMEAR